MNHNLEQLKAMRDLAYRKLQAAKRLGMTGKDIEVFVTRYSELVDKYCMAAYKEDDNE